MLGWPVCLVALAAFAGAALTAPALGSEPDVSAEPLVGDEEAGREYYAEDCRACHSGAIAPSLRGISQRSIASVPDYAFSDGLKAKEGGAWTAEELDAFLAHPSAYAPGTKMMLKVEDAQKRADIVAFLLTL